MFEKNLKTTVTTLISRKSMLYSKNLFNSFIFASLLFVKLLMFLLKNSFDDKYFLKIMVDN